MMIPSIAITMLITQGFATGERLREITPGSLPHFSKLSCDEADLCILVTFADGSSDILETNQENINGKHLNVWKGKALTSGAKAVIIPRDQNGVNLEETIVFNSLKASGCTRFSVDLEIGSGKAECLDQAPRPMKEELTEDVLERQLYFDFIEEDRSKDRSTEEMELSPRGLDPNGYKLRVAVHFDDLFAAEFKSDAENRVAAIMAIVDEMYSEKDTLKTEIEVITVAIEHAKGENWGDIKDWGNDAICYDPTRCPCTKIAVNSGLDVDLHVFLTGSKSTQYILGLAPTGSVCNSKVNKRLSIIKYSTGISKGGDAYTAETVAHEMGHNLGMRHDTLDHPRKPGGQKCYGYMDYLDDTNYWSPCSVADLTSYINRQQVFCLEPIKPVDVNNNGPKVCNNIRVKTKASADEIVWAFGSCMSRNTYHNDNEYNIECCQPEGEYELRCIDIAKDGWAGAYIQIGESDTKFCEDFDEGGVQIHTAVQHTAPLKNVIVKIKLITKKFAEDISWDFGPCASGNFGCNGCTGYRSDYEYKSNCFMPTGNYDLNCKDSYGDGWSGAYIEIAGTKYCEDFDDGSIKTITIKIG